MRRFSSFICLALITTLSAACATTAAPEPPATPVDHAADRVQKARVAASSETYDERARQGLKARQVADAFRLSTPDVDPVWMQRAATLLDTELAPVDKPRFCSELLRVTPPDARSRLQPSLLGECARALAAAGLLDQARAVFDYLQARRGDAWTPFARDYAVMLVRSGGSPLALAELDEMLQAGTALDDADRAEIRITRALVASAQVAPAEAALDQIEAALADIPQGSLIEGLFGRKANLVTVWSHRVVDWLAQSLPERLTAFRLHAARHGADSAQLIGLPLMWHFIAENDEERAAEIARAGGQTLDAEVIDRTARRLADRDYFDVAEALLDSGLEERPRRFNRAIERQARKLRLQAARVYVLRQAGRSTQAIEFAERSLERMGRISYPENRRFQYDLLEQLFALDPPRALSGYSYRYGLSRLQLDAPQLQKARTAMAVAEVGGRGSKAIADRLCPSMDGGEFSRRYDRVNQATVDIFAHAEPFEMLIELGDPTRAREFFEDTASWYPECHLQLLGVLLHQGQRDAARDTMQDAVDTLGPEPVAMMLSMIDTADARTLLDELAKSHPIFVRTDTTLAHAADRKRLEDIWSGVQSDSSPERIAWLEGGTNARGQVEMPFLSDWLSQQKLPNTISALCSAAFVHGVAAYQHEPRSNQGPRAQTYTLERWITFHRRGLEAGRRCYRHPDFPAQNRETMVAWLGDERTRGVAWPEAAVEAAQFFLQKDDNPRIRRRLVDQLLALGRVDEARVQVQTLWERITHSRRPRLAVDMAVSFDSTGTTEVALLYARRAIEATPDEPDARERHLERLTGSILRVLERHQADDLIAKILEIARAQPDPAQLARRLRQMKRPELAAQIYWSADQEAPDKCAYFSDWYFAQLEPTQKTPAEIIAQTGRCMLERLYQLSRMPDYVDNLVRMGRIDLAVQLARIVDSRVLMEPSVAGVSIQRDILRGDVDRVAPPTDTGFEPSVSSADVVADALEATGRYDLFETFVAPWTTAARRLRLRDTLAHHSADRAAGEIWSLVTHRQVEASDAIDTARTQGRYDVAARLIEADIRAWPPSAYDERCTSWHAAALASIGVVDAGTVESLWSNLHTPCEPDDTLSARAHGELRTVDGGSRLVGYADAIGGETYVDLTEVVVAQAWRQLDAGHVDEVVTGFEAELGRIGAIERSDTEHLVSRLGEALIRAGHADRVVAALDRTPGARNRLRTLAALAEQSAPPSRADVDAMAADLSPQLRAALAVKLASWGRHGRARTIARELSRSGSYRIQRDAKKIMISTLDSPDPATCSRLEAELQTFGSAYVPNEDWARAGCPLVATDVLAERTGTYSRADHMAVIGRLIEAGRADKAGEVLAAWRRTYPASTRDSLQADPRHAYLQSWAATSVDGAAAAVMEPYVEDQPEHRALHTGPLITAVAHGRTDEARDRLEALLVRSSFTPMAVEQLVVDLDGQGLAELSDQLGTLLAMERQTNRTLLLMAGAALRQGDRAAAQSWLERVATRTDGAARRSAVYVALAHHDGELASALADPEAGDHGRLNAALGALMEGDQTRSEQLLEASYAARTTHPRVLATVAYAALVGGVDDVAAAYLDRLVAAPESKDRLAIAANWRRAIDVCRRSDRARFGLSWFAQSHPNLISAAIAFDHPLLLDALVDLYRDAGRLDLAHSLTSRLSHKRSDALPMPEVAHQTSILWEPFRVAEE